MAESTANQKPTVAAVDQKVADLENKVADLEQVISGLLDGSIKPGENAPRPTPVDPNPGQGDLLTSFKRSRSESKKEEAGKLSALLKQLQ